MKPFVATIETVAVAWSSRVPVAFILFASLRCWADGGQTGTRYNTILISSAWEPRPTVSHAATFGW
jgi:hypothetical protein